MECGVLCDAEGLYHEWHFDRALFLVAGSIIKVVAKVFRYYSYVPHGGVGSVCEKMPSRFDREALTLCITVPINGHYSTFADTYYDFLKPL